MIIDASVALKWLVTEPDSDLAHALAGRTDLAAPDSLDWEIGHVLSRLSRIRRLSPNEARAAWLALADNPMTRVRTDLYASEAFELSLRLYAGFQDCVYLAVALAQDDVLVTADQHFLKAAAAAGLPGRVISLAAAAS